MPTIVQILGQDGYTNLRSKLAADEVPMAEQIEIVTLLGENVTARCIKEISSQLKPAEVAHLTRLFDKGDSRKLFDFMKKRIPEFESTIRAIADEELSEVLQVTV